MATKTLAQKIADIYIRELKAKESLDKAKDQADNAKVSGIRDLAKLLSGVNEELTPEEIDATALTAAESISTEDRIKKVRKSEIKKMLEQRQNLPRVLDGIEALAEEAKDSDLDPKPKVNVRQDTLKALTSLRKAAQEVAKGKQGAHEKTPDEVVAEIRKDRFERKETPEIDQAEALIEKIEDMDFVASLHKQTGHLVIDTEIDALIAKLRSRLRAVWTGDEGVSHSDVTVSVRRKSAKKKEQDETPVAETPETPDADDAGELPDVDDFDVQGLDDVQADDVQGESTPAVDDFDLPVMDDD